MKKIEIINIMIVAVILLTAFFYVVPVKAGSSGPTPPLRIIPVTGNTYVRVMSNTNTKLIMKDGDEVIFPDTSLQDLMVGVQPVRYRSLPAYLPDGAKFIDAVSVGAFSGNTSIGRLPDNKSYYIYFAKDQMLKDFESTLAILYWDGTYWIETTANQLELNTTVMGLYVLVSR